MTGQLAADSRVGFLSFIGSAQVGWSLRAQLAPGARCALEHGGAAPVIVAADADLDAALPALAKGAFYHAGQVCVSVQWVFAHRSIVESVAEGLAAHARLLRVGDPLLAETEVGPLIRPREVARVHDWVKEARGGGAELLCGGEPLSETCYPPTVLLEPPPGCRVSIQEVFGPVVGVYTYDDMDEAIGRANALPWAFQAAVFTRDYATAMHAFARLDASAVMLNDHTAFRVDWMPFAGAAPIRPWGGRHSLHLPQDADREAVRGADAMRMETAILDALRRLVTARDRRGPSLPYVVPGKWR